MPAQTQESILRSFHRLDKALAAAYDSRVMRWTDFRTHISNRARAMFQHHLTQRGFTGKLKFNHSNCTLDILIQTEADAGSKKAKQKDTKSLSGGEKSFSTICLLLTMWESVGCPLRCLDEFVSGACLFLFRPPLKMLTPWSRALLTGCLHGAFRSLRVCLVDACPGG